MDARQRHALGGVGVALGVVQHLLVAPAGGSLHPGGQPVHAHRLADLGHLPKALLQLVQGGDEGAVRLAEAERAKLAKQQVHAVAHLGLGDPDRSAGTAVGQPLQDDRGYRVQADLQRQRRGAAQPRPAGWGQVGETADQPRQHVCGQRRTRAV